VTQFVTVWTINQNVFVSFLVRDQCFSVMKTKLGSRDKSLGNALPMAIDKNVPTVDTPVKV